MITRREFLTWLGAGTGLAAAAGLGYRFREELSKLGKSMAETGPPFLSVSTASLCRSDAALGLESVVSMLGLEDRGGKAHFHAFFFDPRGQLVDLASTRLGQLQNNLVEHPKDAWLSVLVAIENPASQLLPTHPESAAVIHHRTPWGEDGHHLGQWGPDWGGLGLLPILGRSASLMAATNFSERELTGELRVSDHEGRLLIHRPDFKFAPFATRYFHVGENRFAAPNSLLIEPATTKGPTALLFEFTEASRATITWNGWRAGEASFTSFHGVHTGAWAPRQSIEVTSSLGENAAEFMARHWLYPVDLVPFRAMPDGAAAHATIFIPNTSRESVTPQVYLAGGDGKILGRPRKLTEIPPGGTLILTAGTRDFEVEGELPDYGYALVHFGAKAPPQSLGKVLAFEKDGGAAFMQHFRPLEIKAIPQLADKNLLLNGGLLTDYFVASPSASAKQVLVRNYGTTACRDAEITAGGDGEKRAPPVKLPEIPAGGAIALGLAELGLSGPLRGLRLTAKDAALKISVIHRNPQGAHSLTHGTHRIKELESLAEKAPLLLGRIADRNDV